MAAEKQLIPNSKEENSLFESKFDNGDLGRPDSLRHDVLTWIASEQYEKAIEILREYKDQPNPFPIFKKKASRHIDHAVSLVYAIKAKRSFPGINSLTRTKQQELREKFREHLRELKKSLEAIEKIQERLEADDARSTVYIIHAFWISILAIAALAFWMEVLNGLAKVSYALFDDQFMRIANWIVAKMGL